MNKVRIVGGGLTGILAAFEAHRLGCRDIELHERLENLGGVALPRQTDGLELRDGCLYFGPQGDAVRSALEAHGIIFRDFDNRFGSVSAGPGGGLLVGQEFGGPVLEHGEIEVTGPFGATLGSRLAAYPAGIRTDLETYVRWHLDGADPAGVHESAAIPLAINRVYPVGADLDAMVALKRTEPLYDELYAIPRSLWGRTVNLVASLPAEGFNILFRDLRKRLGDLGVTVNTTSLVSPRQALRQCEDGEVLVWAASPTPLFKAAGLATPPLLKKSFTIYSFKAGFEGPLPFYVQNFTARGAVFRAYLYESCGETILAAECVREDEESSLRADLARLTEPFGALKLGPMIAAMNQPRWIYHSAASVEGLMTLRQKLSAQTEGRFVAGAWEPYSKAEKLAEVNASLAAALGAARQGDRAA
ncbi:MAG: NAD(P)-binding protein [Phenylobacterium sp.]